MLTEREAAIVPAATHAEPIPLAIKRDQRYDHKRHPACVYQRVGGDVRLWNAKPVAAQRITGLPRCKREAAFGLEDRQTVDALRRQLYLPCMQCDFAVGRPVPGDVTGGGSEGKPKQLCGENLGALNAPCRRQFASPGAQLLAQLLARRRVNLTHGHDRKAPRKPLGRPPAPESAAGTAARANGERVSTKNKSSAVAMHAKRP